MEPGERAYRQMLVAELVFPDLDLLRALATGIATARRVGPTQAGTRIRLRRAAIVRFPEQGRGQGAQEVVVILGKPQVAVDIAHRHGGVERLGELRANIGAQVELA